MYGNNNVYVLISFMLLTLANGALNKVNEAFAGYGSTIGGISQRQYGSPGFCPVSTECVPLPACPILNNVMNHACVMSSRIGALGCGYQGSGLVCCPRYSEDDRGPHVDGKRCGVPSVQGRNYYGIGAYPWIARVGFRNVLNGDLQYPCAGSIINNRVILTAAHCALAKSDNYKLVSVRIGEWNTNTEIDCGEEFCSLPVQDIGVSHIIVHPEYDQKIYKHNIALMVLRSPLNYTVTAQPICLPEQWSQLNNDGILVGWGKAASQLETPPRQQVLELPLISLRQCENIYGRTLPITENHICAGGVAGKDACSGFGGSPLLLRNGGNYYQVGILSFGSDQCGAPGVPSVYTNVRKYIRWIQDNIPQIYNNN